MFQKQNQLSYNNSTYLPFLKKAGYKEPTLLQKKILPLSLKGKNLFIEAPKNKGRTASYLITLLLKIMKNQSKTKALIIISTAKLMIKVEKEYKRFKPSSQKSLSLHLLGDKNNLKKDFYTLRNNPDIIIGTADRIIDHIRRNNINLSGIQITIIDIPEIKIDEGFIKDTTYIFSKLPKKQQILIYAPRFDASLYSLSQKAQLLSESNWKQGPELENHHKEKNKMNPKDNSSRYEKKQVKEIFQSLIRKIKEDEDPDELNEYRKLFRKNVPLPLRSYMAAYFFKEAYFKKGISIGTGISKRIEKENRNSQENLKTLFVSIGKNRRVYAKDLYKYFTTVSGINQSSIKNIKVMDNYSFIDITNNLAQKVIKTLDGKEFRGKKLTINFARNKTY